MKKVIGLIVVLSLIWIVKLSYDLFQMTSQLPQLQEKILKLEQSNATLNDQLVALQRHFNPEDSIELPKQAQPQAGEAVVVDAPSGVEPIWVIQQHSELIQFALQQQQYVYALEQLNRLDQNLESYSLSPALKQSLHQVLANDRQSIQHFMAARTTQQNTLDGLLSQIDRLLGQALQQQQLSPAKAETRYFWEKWLQIDRIEQSSADLVNRKLILKEAQLRLLLARQALSQGQYLEYQQVLSSAIQQFDYLPDASSQQLKQRLIKAKNLPVLPVPKLNVGAVLGGE